MGRPGGSFGGGTGGGGGGGWSGGGRTRRQQGQTVYVLSAGADKKPALREVRITAGITDGHYTQVASVLSGTLNVGDPVVTGLATLKVEAPAGANNRGPGGPGGPRGFGRF